MLHMPTAAGTGGLAGGIACLPSYIATYEPSHLRTYAYTCAYVFVCVCVCVCVYMRVWFCVCMRMYIHVCQLAA